MRRLLSGNEAVARGAWEARVRVAAGYPGTPSTEILESLATMPGVYAEWSPNERVAINVAIGAAYAGSRSMVAMKQVGLNVAADAFFYAAITGLEAGMLAVIVDDPGIHSSQGEQDSRRYAKFARVPCVEPSNSQEAKDLVGVALAVSEQFDVPVMLRSTTRVAHTYTIVEVAPQQDGAQRADKPSYKIDAAKYVMTPANARERRPVMEERTRRLADFSDAFPWNVIEPGDPALGIVTSGVAYQHAREVFPQASYLKLGMSYPVPGRLLASFASQVRRLIVIEELDPFIEEEIKLLGIKCEGKSIFPLIGELNAEIIRRCAISAGVLPEPARPIKASVPKPVLPPRAPVLCPGCPHRGVFVILRKLKLVVNGDIGCYGLGLMPPLNAVHTCGCMGASIGAAHGVVKAGVQEKNIALIGDSTFFHSGLPALLNVAYNKSNTITVIMDNRTTAMTGHQQHPGTGYTLQQEQTEAVPLEPLVRALGIKRVHTIDPYILSEIETALRDCLSQDGPAVVIARRDCVQLPGANRRDRALEVDPSKCVGCGACRSIGCTAVLKSDELTVPNGRHKSIIDPVLCKGCGICAQVCPSGAILVHEQAALECVGAPSR